MSDDTEHGAVPVEDAAVDDPPTVEEVLARQRAEHPEQAATSMDQPRDVRVGNQDEAESSPGDGPG